MEICRSNVFCFCFLFSALGFSLFLCLFDNSPAPALSVSVAADAAWGVYFWDVRVWSEGETTSELFFEVWIRHCTAVCQSEGFFQFFFTRFASKILCTALRRARHGGPHSLCFAWNSLIAYQFLISSPWHTPYPPWWWKPCSGVGGATHFVVQF